MVRRRNTTSLSSPSATRLQQCLDRTRWATPAVHQLHGLVGHDPRGAEAVPAAIPAPVAIPEPAFADGLLQGHGDQRAGRQRPHREPPRRGEAQEGRLHDTRAHRAAAGRPAAHGVPLGAPHQHHLRARRDGDHRDGRRLLPPDEPGRAPQADAGAPRPLPVAGPADGPGAAVDRVARRRHRRDDTAAHQRAVRPAPHQPGDRDRWLPHPKRGK